MRGLISSFICSHSLARAAIRRVAADLREVNRLALRPSTDRRATAKRGSPSYSTEQRETVRSELRIPARMIVHAHPRRQESRIVARTRFQPSCRPAKCPLQLGRMPTAPLSHGVQSCLFSARDLAYARRKEHFPKSASCSHSVGACSCSVSKLNAPICTPCRESPRPCAPRAQCGQPSILADPTRGCIREQGTYMHPRMGGSERPSRRSHWREDAETRRFRRPHGWRREPRRGAG